MKTLLNIIIGLLFVLQQLSAQTEEKLETFKSKALPEFSTYFGKAELSDNGHLSLKALEKYNSLTLEEKTTVIKKLSKQWSESLIVVAFGTKIELWGKSTEMGGIQLLDMWDMNPAPILISTSENVSAISKHPWFLYLGGVLGGDNQKNINFTFSTRLGFFLLADKWDFSTSLTAGSIANTSSDNSSGWSSFGLMTRWHIPVKKSSIRPNIGANIQFGTSGTQGALSLGLMWFVGFGSIDIAFNFGNEFTTLAGYTVYPKLKNKK